MNLGWCVSGGGMGARAVHQAQIAGLIATPISVIIMDRMTSMADYCREHGIPCLIGDAETVHGEIVRAQRKWHLDWLGLTFNRLVRSDAIHLFRGQIFNLHMSLLPKYPGFGAIKAALRNGDEETGVTVHIADESTDGGPIMAQSSCPILDDDDASSLGLRMFHRAVPLLIQTVRDIESGQEHLGVDEDVATFAEEFCAAL